MEEACSKLNRFPLQKTTDHHPDSSNLLAVTTQWLAATDLYIHCVSKKFPPLNSVTLSNLNRFSNFLHCWKACEICYI